MNKTTLENWEDTFTAEFKDFLWSDPDSLAVDQFNKVRQFIKDLLAQAQQEAVSDEREKIIKKYGRYIEHGQYQAKTLKEALQCD